MDGRREGWMRGRKREKKADRHTNEEHERKGHRVLV